MTHVPQVGGDHYQSQLQHWDIIEKYDISYLEATATKYLMRWRRKGVPVEDLGKSISYLNKLLALRNDGTRRHVPMKHFSVFVEENKLDEEDAKMIRLILVEGSRSDLVDARDMAAALMAAEEAKAA